MKPSKRSLKQSNPKSGAPRKHSMPAVLGAPYGLANASPMEETGGLWGYAKDLQDPYKVFADTNAANDGPEVRLLRFFRRFPQGATRQEVGDYWVAKIRKSL